MNFLKKSLLVAATLLTGINAVQAQWSLVGSAGLSAAVANYTFMAVDNNDVPYIAYKDNSVGDKLSVKKWTGSSWATVGSLGISGGSVDNLSMAIDLTNNYVYVAYKDASASNKLTVKLWNGSSWSTLGSTGFTSSSIDYPCIAVYNSIVLVAYRDNSVSGKMTCSYYSGGWYTLGSAGITSGAVTYISTHVTPNGLGYIGYRDHNNKPAMLEWTNNGWISLGTASTNSCSDVSIAADINGDPYIVFVDQGNSNKLTVRKYTTTWSTVGTAGFTPGGTATPEIAIDLNNNTPYVVYRDDNNNQKASVMKFNGTSWSNLGSAGFTSNTVEYTNMVIDDNGILYVGYKDNAVGQKATVMKFGTGSSGAGSITWDGSASTDWNTGANWSTNAVPTETDNVVIPASMPRYPLVNTATTVYCKNLTINTNATLTINHTSAKLRVTGNLDNDGTFTIPDGRLEMKGTTAQTIHSVHTLAVDEFRLQNTAGCTLNDSLAILDYYLPTSGTLTTNSKLILRSTSTKTGRVDIGATTGAYISGNVVVERYVPGKRVYRFLSHPFSSAIALNQLIDDIDITGSGGSSNGFTTVSVNAPSSFYFDVTTADTSTGGTNPGWKAFTSANTASWDPYEMARVFIRGSKGQGLTQAPYTPNAVTMDMIGPLTQGDKTITLPKGTNSTFVTCGNPFANAVNLKNVARSSNIAANFSVWVPSQGTYGGYTAYQFASDYYLPACGAFVAEITSGTSGSFTFEEADKVTNTPASLFKGTADPITFTDTNFIVELNVEDTFTFWDRVLVEFDGTSVATKDDRDMEKLNNPDLDFYTIMPDTEYLAIDVRPYDSGKVIPLGIWAYEDMKLAIRVPRFKVPEGAKLVFHDHHLNFTDTLKAGFEYWFDVKMSDTTTFGDSRFSINMHKDTPVGVKDLNIKQVINNMHIAPNPATDFAYVTFDALQKDAAIRVADVTGRIVYAENIAAGISKYKLPVQQLQTGIYIVELESDGKKSAYKLVKQ